MNAKVGMVRHSIAWAASRVVDEAKSAKELFDAVREGRFPLGSIEEQKLLREFRLQRRKCDYGTTNPRSANET